MLSTIDLAGDDGLEVREARKRRAIDLLPRHHLVGYLAAGVALIWIGINLPSA